MFEECGLGMNSNTSAEDFKKLILSGTYEMRQDYDTAEEVIKRVQKYPDDYKGFFAQMRKQK